MGELSKERKEGGAGREWEQGEREGAGRVREH